MSELVVQVDDVSIFPDIEKAISMLRGVVSVSLKRTKKSGLEKAIEEVKAGKLYEADSVDDLMKQLNS